MFKRFKNYVLCRRYPFMRWYGDPLYKGYPHRKHYSLSYTWYDEIPLGWRKAFGKKLLKEIKQAGLNYLGKKKKDGSEYKWSDIITWEQIKEKWGELCLYASAVKEVRNILDKYELLSEGYCIECGKPARYRSKGWIEYYCDDCFEKQECYRGMKSEKTPLSEEETNKFKEECRLTKNDIPSYYNYHKTLNGKYIKRKVNLKKKYNIDFKELWGLNDGRKDNSK